VLLNDYFLIEDLAGLDAVDRLMMLQILGDESADWAVPILERAFDRFQRVILATHVPPFRDACQYEGRTCDDDWLPHMTNHALGTALLKLMRQRTGRSLTVLCGHTHGEGAIWVRPNLQVRTGGAEYGRPRIQGLLEVP